MVVAEYMAENSVMAEIYGRIQCRTRSGRR